MRILCGTILAAAVCLSAGALAGEHAVLRLGAPFADHACRFALTNALSVLRFDAKGRVASVVERETGRELLVAPTAFVALRLRDGGMVEATILFNRTGAVGGMLSLGNGPARPLATGVQPQQGLAPLD